MDAKCPVPPHKASLRVFCYRPRPRIRTLATTRQHRGFTAPSQPRALCKATMKAVSCGWVYFNAVGPM